MQRPIKAGKPRASMKGEILPDGEVTCPSFVEGVLLLYGLICNQTCRPTDQSIFLRTSSSESVGRAGLQYWPVSSQSSYYQVRNAG